MPDGDKHLRYNVLNQHPFVDLQFSEQQLAIYVGSYPNASRPFDEQCDFAGSIVLPIKELLVNFSFHKDVFYTFLRFLAYSITTFRVTTLPPSICKV